MSKKKQIEEMAKTLCEDCAKSDPCSLAAIGGMCNSVRKQATAMCNAGYRKQEWISVSERLPSDEEQRDEYGELVPFLVCERDTTYPYRAFYDGKEWGDGLMRIRGITHWMPLPEPPKKK